MTQTGRAPRATPAAKAGRASAPMANRALPLAGLILFQTLCWGIFVIDVGSDMMGQWPDLALNWHVTPEIGATLGLLVGIGFEIGVLVRLLRRQASLEQGLRVAAGALAQIMEEYFRDWSLTPSEQDIAAFTIKGFSIAEIAQMRGSAEGTVKTHLNAIYRKAGVSGRAQLVSLLVEDLLRFPEAEGPQGSADSPKAGPIGKALP
jgi:DNA-binding CsgD family transcriptional regulator